MSFIGLFHFNIQKQLDMFALGCFIILMNLSYFYTGAHRSVLFKIHIVIKDCLLHILSAVVVPGPVNVFEFDKIRKYPGNNTACENFNLEQKPVNNYYACRRNRYLVLISLVNSNLNESGWIKQLEGVRKRL